MLISLKKFDYLFALKAMNYFIFSKPKTCNFVISIKNMGVLNQIAEYLYLKKKDPNAPDSQWVKYMHGINRISLIMFLIGLIILAVKLIRK